MTFDTDDRFDFGRQLLKSDMCSSWICRFESIRAQSWKLLYRNRPSANDWQLRDVFQDRSKYMLSADECSSAAESVSSGDVFGRELVRIFASMVWDLTATDQHDAWWWTEACYIVYVFTIIFLYVRRDCLWTMSDREVVTWVEFFLCNTAWECFVFWRLHAVC